MKKFLIGAESPMFAGVGHDENRRWSTAVHAIEDGEDGPPFRARCGRYVDFLNFGWEWPPELSERSCPSCVRLTLEPRFDGRADSERGRDGSSGTSTRRTA